MEVIKANLFHLELQLSSSTYLPNYHISTAEAVVYYTVLKWTSHTTAIKSWTKVTNSSYSVSLSLCKSQGLLLQMLLLPSISCFCGQGNMVHKLRDGYLGRKQNRNHGGRKSLRKERIYQQHFSLCPKKHKATLWTTSVRQVSVTDVQYCFKLLYGSVSYNHENLRYRHMGGKINPKLQLEQSFQNEILKIISA